MNECFDGVISAYVLYGKIKSMHVSRVVVQGEKEIAAPLYQDSKCNLLPIIRRIINCKWGSEWPFLLRERSMLDGTCNSPCIITRINH